MQLADRITHDLAKATLARAMSQHVGREHPISFEALEVLTGISVSTLRSYDEGRATSGLSWTMRLFCALGPGFTNQVIALAGLGGAERLQVGELKPTALAAQISTCLAELLHRLADGELTHKERADMAPRLRQLAVEAEAAASAIERGHQKLILA